jgi:hypothetical protein
MAQDLKADTASQVVRVGPAVDKDDGFTVITTLTLAGADEFVVIKNDGTVVDISGRTTDLAAVTGADGMYDFTITDTDLSLEGSFEIVATDVSLCLPIVNRFNVMSADAYEAKYGDTLLEFTSDRDTLAASGSEQTVYEVASPAAEWIPDTVHIDLSNMAASDSTDIKVYVKLKSGGTYRMMDVNTFTDEQTVEGIVITGIPNRYGYKVTLEQTAGSNRNYDWERYSFA